jgi:hypothetical protein
MTDLFRGDDAYHNGAFMLAAQFLLYSNYFWIRSAVSICRPRIRVTRSITGPRMAMPSSCGTDPL